MFCSMHSPGPLCTLLISLLWSTVYRIMSSSAWVQAAPTRTSLLDRFRTPVSKWSGCGVSRAPIGISSNFAFRRKLCSSIRTEHTDMVIRKACSMLVWDHDQSHNSTLACTKQCLFTARFVHNTLRLTHPFFFRFITFHTVQISHFMIGLGG